MIVLRLVDDDQIRAFKQLIADVFGLPTDPTSITAAAMSITAAGVVNFTGGNVYINETANTNMTIGLTINQGANDNQLLCGKSSDVAHGGVNLGQASESDDFFAIKKFNAAGGVEIQSINDDASEPRIIRFSAACLAASNTAKTTGGAAAFTINVAEHDSAGNLANMTADGNALSVTVRKGGSATNVFLVDEDGDFHYDGADGGAFDRWKDTELVRALDLVRPAASIIQSKWDEHVRYNEAALIDAGVLGDTIANGGLINGAQLQRLHNGAIWQLHCGQMELREEVAEIKRLALEAR